MENISIDDIWDLYDAEESSASRVKLFEFYAPWSRKMAAILYKKYHHHLLQYEDYLSIVSQALIESIDKYNRARNVPFEAFCFTRMKGYVLNEVNRLRKADCPFPNSEYFLFSREAADDLTHSFESLEDIVDFTIHSALEMLLATDHRDEEPLNQYSKNQLIERIHNIIRLLPESERVVINTYYHQYMNYEQIGELLCVSKARISQLHKSAISSIRQIYEKSY